MCFEHCLVVANAVCANHDATRQVRTRSRAGPRAPAVRGLRLVGADREQRRGAARCRRCRRCWNLRRECGVRVSLSLGRGPPGGGSSTGVAAERGFGVTAAGSPIWTASRLVGNGFPPGIWVLSGPGGRFTQRGRVGVSGPRSDLRTSVEARTDGPRAKSRRDLTPISPASTTTAAGTIEAQLGSAQAGRSQARRPGAPRATSRSGAAWYR
jgi:hypothetical protein